MALLPWIMARCRFVIIINNHRQQKFTTQRDIVIKCKRASAILNVQLCIRWFPIRMSFAKVLPFQGYCFRILFWHSFRSNEINISEFYKRNFEWTMDNHKVFNYYYHEWRERICIYVKQLINMNSFVYFGSFICPHIVISFVISDVLFVFEMNYKCINKLYFYVLFFEIQDYRTL